MNRALVPVLLLTLVVIGGGAAWYLTDTRKDSLTPTQPVINPAPEISEGKAIYTNGIYGFSVFYPENADISYDFDPAQNLGASWRTNALPDVTGTTIVSITPYRVMSEDSYPRSYIATVRIGASLDPREVERCEEVDASAGETALPAQEIGGKTWSAFSFESAGMHAYVRGVSYRTVHEERCIAMEQIRAGSSYREAPTDRDIPDATLEEQYELLSQIVASFSFAR